jgi:pimeloyl-ACP methyl ester carboxylesterase
MRLRENKLSIEGTDISFVVTDGPKAAVLLIHGNSSCREVFAHQVAFLTDRGYRVVAPDLPGHGKSSDAATPFTDYSFPGYARTLGLLMRSLGLHGYHIVGWSLGGHIGIEMWSSQEPVQSLLITGTPPVQLSPLGASEGFLASPVMDLAGKELFSREDCLAYGSAMLDEPPDDNSAVWRAIARTDGRARRYMVENGLAGVGMDEVAAMASCPKPIAILQGENDPFISLGHLGRLTYNNLWLKNPILLKAGHAPHRSHPTEFNRHLGDFLAVVDAL